MNRGVLNVFKFLLPSLLGLFLLPVVVFADTSSNYKSLMEDLEVAHKKVLSSVNAQSKKIEKEYTFLKKTLEKDYSYMSLYCLGILKLDYTPNPEVKKALLGDLLEFNQTIYRYHLGLGGNVATIKEELVKFISHDIAKDTEKMYQDYQTYKKDFLGSIRLYVKNNTDIIMPLISKMKTIQSVKKEFSELQALTKKTQNVLAKDDLLWKVAMLKNKFRVVLSKRFDVLVKKQGINKSAQEIARIKSQFLSEYDNDFDALYTVVLSVPYYDLDDTKFNDFMVKYYNKDQYDCPALVGDTGTFAANRRYLSTWFVWEKENLMDFSRAVVGYFKLDVAEQNKRKVVMVQGLKKLLDDYMGVKLTTLLLRM